MSELPKSSSRCEYVSADTRAKASQLPIQSTEGDRRAILDTGRCTRPSEILISMYEPNSFSYLSADNKMSCSEHVGSFLMESQTKRATIESIESRAKRIPVVSTTMEDDMSMLGLSEEDVSKISDSAVRTAVWKDRTLAEITRNSGISSSVEGDMSDLGVTSEDFEHLLAVSAKVANSPCLIDELFTSLAGREQLARAR